jgi:hypothetical protein
MATTRRHCDEVIEDPDAPHCLRWFLLVNRLPAVDQLVLEEALGQAKLPKLFARHNGRPVRVVMASRFGDVGISTDLSRPNGYQQRVGVDELTDFCAEHRDLVGGDR